MAVSSYKDVLQRTRYFFLPKNKDLLKCCNHTEQSPCEEFHPVNSPFPHPVAVWSFCRTGFGAPVAARGPHPRSQPWSCLWKCSMQVSLLKNEAPCWMLLEWSVCSLPTSSPPLPCPMLDSSALNRPGEGKSWRLASISSQLPVLSKQMA